MLDVLAEAEGMNDPEGFQDACANLETAQQWLDNNYPLGKRSRVKIINLGSTETESNFLCLRDTFQSNGLELRDFSSLEKFSTSGKDGISGLKMINCPNLKCLNCSGKLVNL